MEGFSTPHSLGFAARAQMRLPNGERRFVWINPYTGSINGTTPWLSAQRILRNTHRHLMMPVKWGVPLVAALAIPLLLSLASSLYIYKRWWRGFNAWPRPDRPRRFWGDVHRLAGVWSMWFILLIGITGAWYFLEALGVDAPDPIRNGSDDANTPHHCLAPALRDASQALDNAVSQTKARWPAFELRAIVPSWTTCSVLLQGQAEACLVRDRANAVYVQLGATPQIRAFDGRELTPHQRIAEMADPLHFGTFGGWPIQLLWLVAGAFLTALCVTGAYIYGLRITESLRSVAKRRTTG